MKSIEGIWPQRSSRRGAGHWEYRIDSDSTERCCYHNHGRLNQRWIVKSVVLPHAIETAVIKDAVARPDRRLALTERILGQTDARAEIEI